MLSSDEEPEYNEIDVIFNKNEFENLIETKQYARTEKKRNKLHFRQYKVLKSGSWQEAITKLWEKYKLQCGYQFKWNKIFNNSLVICGKCNCGSIINGVAENITDNNQTVIIKCKITKGSGTCSKRYLRNPIRFEIGEQLCKENESAII